MRRAARSGRKADLSALPAHIPEVCCSTRASSFPEAAQGRESVPADSGNIPNLALRGNGIIGALVESLLSAGLHTSFLFSLNCSGVSCCRYHFAGEKGHEVRQSPQFPAASGRSSRSSWCSPDRVVTLSAHRAVLSCSSQSSPHPP